ncbi:ABC transporter permease [Xylophilus sp.]|uniref:ABC transporter permease n=1 Tax=Xylophilus sp. TaxID=2653893 RepID=UPI0013BD37ED|nr:ABC transporter permease [Xylophilus sp.]KAF1045189.1 MAG: putative aliphatic sulfonates transport permease protein SsuC [Xylophilus sp.]
MSSLPLPAAGRARRVREASPHILRGAAAVLACVLAWHLLSTRHANLGLVTFANVPPPGEVLESAWAFARSPKLWPHLASSLQRVGLGFGLAALAGIVLGLLIGRLRWARDVLLPPLEVLRPIPAVAWIPLAILMFPSSEGSMVFITFVGALFPILLSTIHGVEAVDPRLVASARSLGTRRWRLFTEVIAPGALPGIVTGLSIGMGTCWFCLVTAEMIAGQYGIGYHTWEAYTIQNYADIVVGMLVIGLLGMGSSALIRAAGRRLTPWYRPQGAGR